MEERTIIDISEFSFEDFISFLFDREVQPEGEKWNPWYWHTNVSFNSERICGYYIRLFIAPDFLLERFSKAQLEEGFWAIVSAENLACSVNELIWNTIYR
jgi:hypothetical protein